MINYRSIIDLSSIISMSYNIILQKQHLVGLQILSVFTRFLVKICPIKMYRNLEFCWDIIFFIRLYKCCQNFLFYFYHITYYFCFCQLHLSYSHQKFIIYILFLSNTIESLFYYSKASSYSVFKLVNINHIFQLVLDFIFI